MVHLGKSECVEWRETGDAAMALVDRTKTERSRRWSGVTECPVSPLRIAVGVANNAKFLSTQLFTASMFRKSKSDNKYRTRGKCRRLPRTPLKNVSEKLPVECGRKKWIKTEVAVWQEADIR